MSSYKSNINILNVQKALGGLIDSEKNLSCCIATDVNDYGHKPHNKGSVGSV